MVLIVGKHTSFALLKILLEFEFSTYSNAIPYRIERFKLESQDTCQLLLQASNWHTRCPDLDAFAKVPFKIKVLEERLEFRVVFQA